MLDERYDKLIGKLKELKESQKLKTENIKKLEENCAQKKKELEAHYSKIESLLQDLNTELIATEKVKSDLLNSFQFDKEQKGIIKKDKDIPYKKFYFRQSKISKLLMKPDYQTIYNITLSYLFLTGIYYLLNLNYSEFSVEKISNKIELTIKGCLSLALNYFIKMNINVLLVLIIHISGRYVNIVFPITLTTVYYFLFVKYNFFANTSSVIIINMMQILDNSNFFLKISSYYFEKKLMITYRSYNKHNGIKKTEEEYKAILKKNLIISDKGTDPIEFTVTKLNIFKEIKNYIFFYYVPTFIYRDEYPISPTRNIGIHLINIILSYIFLYFEIEILIHPLIAESINRSYFKERLIYILSSMTIYSIFGLFVFIFGFVHSYYNLIGEILKLGDKKFYRKFYNANTPKKFITKLANLYTEFCEYYLYYLIEEIIFKNFSEKWIKNVKIVAIDLFFLLVFKYFTYLCFDDTSLICSFCFTIVFIFSDYISDFKGYFIYFINWLILTWGLGIVGFILYTETLFLKRYNLDLAGININEMNFFERNFLPKVLYVFVQDYTK